MNNAENNYTAMEIEFEPMVANQGSSELPQKEKEQEKRLREYMSGWIGPIILAILPASLPSLFFFANGKMSLGDMLFATFSNATIIYVGITILATGLINARKVERESALAWAIIILLVVGNLIYAGIQMDNIDDSSTGSPMTFNIVFNVVYLIVALGAGFTGIYRLYRAERQRFIR